jgi:hypothetical protein
MPIATEDMKFFLAVRFGRLWKVQLGEQAQ